MKFVLHINLVLSILLLLSACQKGVEPGVNNSSTNGGGNNNGNSGGQTADGWTIPFSQVFDAGPGKDGIPALLNPTLINASEASYLNDNDLVLGYKSGNEVVAYPHAILDWHEIINHDIGDKNIAITYCPLTGTGIGWDRQINGEVTTFGVTGLLYNTNLMPYDRKTDSNWSQMRLDCVNGELINTKAKTYNLVETTWKTWKSMYPDTKVVSTNTGFDRNYQFYPYGNYREDNNLLLFPVNPTDSRLPSKERVLGVIVDGKAKVYQFGNFVLGAELVRDNFNNASLLVVGSQTDNFLLAFENDVEGQSRNFEVVQNKLPIILKDDLGNEWDVFGKAVTGPDEGKELKSVQSFIGFWFSWGAFYATPEIYTK